MNKELIRWYYLFRGKKEMKKNHFLKAIEYFKKALSLLPSQNYWQDTDAVFIDPLAQVLFMSGNLESAQEQFEKITALTIGRLSSGKIVIHP